MYDSHCHINEKGLIERSDEVFAAAKEAGVTSFLVVGWDLESSQKAVDMAREHESTYAAVGFHPENLDNISDNALAFLKLLAMDERVVAIGEIGLDYHWFKETEHRQMQKEWFIKQIDLANKLHLPAVIHARDASGDMLALLKEHPIEAGAVLHCYSGSVETMKELAKLGYYFGFDGPITFKNAVEPKECVKACPIDRLLVETDCPYMAPTPLRGTVNEPKNIPLIVKAMADLRGLTVEEMDKQLTENFERLFRVKHE